MIDLHMHSTFSDGKYTPTELRQKSNIFNTKFMALTDHDTLSGLEELHNKTDEKEANLHTISGVELSVHYKHVDGRTHELHLVGLLFDYKDIEFNNFVNSIKENRQNRNNKLIQMYSEKFGLDKEQVNKDLSGIESIGRPHIANHMLEHKLVGSFQEAFDRYLKPGKELYVEKSNPDMKAGIDAVRKAGGLSFLAHPGIYKGMRSFELFENVKELGVDGVEAYSSQHKIKQMHKFYKLSERFDLLVSIGSDFHGYGKYDTFQNEALNIIKLKDFDWLLSRY